MLIKLLVSSQSSAAESIYIPLFSVSVEGKKVHTYDDHSEWCFNSYSQKSGKNDEDGVGVHESLIWRFCCWLLPKTPCKEIYPFVADFPPQDNLLLDLALY